MLPYLYQLSSNQADPSMRSTVHWYSSPVNQHRGKRFFQTECKYYAPMHFNYVLQYPSATHFQPAHMGYLDIISCIRVIWVFNTFLYPMHKLQLIFPCRIFKRCPNPPETRISGYPYIHTHIHMSVYIAGYTHAHLVHGFLLTLPSTVFLPLIIVGIFVATIGGRLSLFPLPSKAYTCSVCHPV